MEKKYSKPMTVMMRVVTTSPRAAVCGTKRNSGRESPSAFYKFIKLILSGGALSVRMATLFNFQKQISAYYENFFHKKQEEKQEERRIKIVFLEKNLSVQKHFVPLHRFKPRWRNR